MMSENIVIKEKDILLEQAAKLVLEHNAGSPSMLQRHLKLGYHRAGKIMDQLEEAGIVGPYTNFLPREVLVSSTADLDQILKTIENE